MNLAQKKHSADHLRFEDVPTGRDGYWAVSGSALTFAGKVWPRGSVVPTSLVERIEHGRLGVMIQNRLLARRLGSPPADAPQPHALPAPVDSARAAAEQKASLKRDGYADWETTAGVQTPSGPYLNPAHPSGAVKTTAIPVSQGGIVYDP